MLREINYLYRNFHDALILNINYDNLIGQRNTATVELQTFNYQLNELERVKIFFEGVIKFRFFESRQICSTVIFEVFFEKDDNGTIIFDFFALQVDGIDKLAEDPNSSFVIHCKGVKFEKQIKPLN